MARTSCFAEGNTRGSSASDAGLRRRGRGRQLRPAARLLHLSPPAVTRAVAALESAWASGCSTAPRAASSLTEAGACGFSTARGGCWPSSTRPSGRPPEPPRRPSGHLRVTAPVTFGRMHLMPVLADFLRAQPQVTATLVTLDRVANLIEEGFDLAVRIAHFPEFDARRPPDRRGAAAAGREPGYLGAARDAEPPRDLRAA